MENPETQQGGTGGPEELPPDFASRIATKIVFTSERERDPEEALEKISTMLIRNLGRGGRTRQFIDVLEALEDDPETIRFSGLAVVSLVMDKQEDPPFEKFIDDFLETMIHDHKTEFKKSQELEYRRKNFSAYARILGESLIAMYDINNELYEVASHVFTLLIRKEMMQEMEAKEASDQTSRRISLSDKEEGEHKVGKKLFDDLVDYIHSRGEQRSGTLQQQNPNEFISVLADRMRGTRRYVIQDILNTQAMDRRKEAEKELGERLASAEEIVMAKEAFKRGVSLYWTERQYNFKYMSVEKVRVTVQVLAMCLGVFHFLLGYLGVFGILWWEGVITTVAMYFFARFFGSRQYFNKFFPDDVTKELEVVVGSFTPTFRKMSQEQLDAFLNRQTRDPGNLKIVTILPEFIKYVFAVMPDRRNVVIQREELGELMQNVEMDIARIIRTVPPGSVIGI